jgi:hypothetical protein
MADQYGFEPDGKMHGHRTSKGPIHMGGSDRKHGHDKHAHETHKAHNKEHDTGYCAEEDHFGGHGEHGGEGMASNAHYESSRKQSGEKAKD